MNVVNLKRVKENFFWNIIECISLFNLASKRNFNIKKPMNETVFLYVYINGMVTNCLSIKTSKITVS